jgi:type IV fimbrial biogenesis protein FimT
VQAPPNGTVVVTANVASMLYDPVRGTTSPTATIAVGAPESAGLRHVVNILGRVRTCAPAGGLRGYRACS